MFLPKQKMPPAKRSGKTFKQSIFPAKYLKKNYLAHGAV